MSWKHDFYEWLYEYPNVLESTICESVSFTQTERENSRWNNINAI